MDRCRGENRAVCWQSDPDKMPVSRQTSKLETYILVWNVLKIWLFCSCQMIARDEPKKIDLFYKSP